MSKKTHKETSLPNCPHQRSQNIKNFSLCTSHLSTKSPSSEYSGHHLTRIRSVSRLVIAPPIQDFGNVGEASSVIIIFITCPSCLVRGELPISNAAPLCVSAAAASSATVSNAHNIRTTDDSEIGCRRGAQHSRTRRPGEERVHEEVNCGQSFLPCCCCCTTLKHWTSNDLHT